jgi:hypothetical protein
MYAFSRVVLRVGLTNQRILAKKFCFALYMEVQRMLSNLRTALAVRNLRQVDLAIPVRFKLALPKRTSELGADSGSRNLLSKSVQGQCGHSGVHQRVQLVIRFKE